MKLSDLEPEVQNLLLNITNEVARGNLIHGKFRSVHEAYAVLLEELDEFWDEVKLKQHDKAAMKKELIQLAAMCLKTIEFLETK